MVFSPLSAAFFFGLFFGVEALPIHDCGDVDTHTNSFFRTTTRLMQVAHIFV